tara:strand:- start:1296 stop:2153 length:858 start_codon:yes stop_codon:yes gene_type:complete
VKALVTGANGQVGQALQATAPSRWTVVAFDRSTMDLADPQAIRNAILSEGPDVVFNAGAYTAVDQAEHDQEMARKVNGEAPGVIAQTLSQTGGRLVQISTDFVFDGSRGAPYSVKTKPNPLSIYGATKLLGEKQAGDDAIVCRTSWVYGASGRNFVRTMLRLFKERESVSVVSDQIGVPTWSRGLAETLWTLAVKDRPGVFHYQDAGVASWYDFAIAVQEEALAIGLLSRAIPIEPIRTSQYPTPATRPPFSVLDTTVTQAVTGQSPTHWRENLRKMLREEKKLG